MSLMAAQASSLDAPITKAGIQDLKLAAQPRTSQDDYQTRKLPQKDAIRRATFYGQSVLTGKLPRPISK